MKAIYFDCGMGAAGDMLTAALLDLLSEKEQAEFVSKMNGLGIEGLQFERSASEKCGIKGCHVTVKVQGEEEHSVDVDDHHHDHHEHEHHEHSHHHSSLSDVFSIIDSFSLEDKVKEDIRAIYGMLAEAESKVHGTTVSQIHFHEVGTVDAICDVTAVCILMNMLAPGAVYASPVHVGAGKVRCAHGILTVPTPATAELLSGVPIYGGRIESELCTPTGAAILKHYVNHFGNMPVLSVEKTGYGMGNKDFEVANCVRAMYGYIADTDDSVCELSFNVDDMTGEEIGFATEELINHGALDVFVTPIIMKKSRPGQMITVICKHTQKMDMASLIMKHTTTLGIREKACGRMVLNRNIDTIDTGFGTVHVKSSEGYGSKKSKVEYEDLARIARENNMSLYEVRKLIDY